MKSQDFLVLLGYIFASMSRGTMIYNLSTVIIIMYSQVVKKPFPTDGVVLAVLSVANMLGSMVGSLGGTYVIRKIGRRNTLLVGSMGGLVTNLMCCVKVNWQYIACVRALCGCLTCLVITSGPMLFSEFLQPEQRGTYGSSFNLFLTFGFFFCNVLQIFITKAKYFWVSFIPSALCCLGTFAIALKFSETNKELEDTRTDVGAKESIYQKKYIKCFIIAITLGLNPFAGQNAIINYSTKIFAAASTNPKGGQIGGILISFVSLVSCIISVICVKKYDRRLVLTIGCSTFMISLAYLIIVTAAIKDTNKQFWYLFIGCTVFLLGQNCSYGALYVVICSEVFPLSIKNEMMNIAYIAVWVAVIAVTYIFPLVPPYASYAIFLTISVVNFGVLILYLPETRNKSFAEIERLVVTQLPAQQRHDNVDLLETKSQY